MPEFIGGLPLHPLLVHFTVVLLVLAVGGAVLTAVLPAVRRRYGWLVVGAAVVGTVLVPFTTSSGNSLATRVQAPGVAEHERLGDMMIWWALGVTVAVGALMVVHTMASRKATAKVAVGAAGVETEEPRQATKVPAIVMILLSLVTVGAAVGAGIHVYRVGDSGARAVWEGVKDLPVRGG